MPQTKHSWFESASESLVDHPTDATPVIGTSALEANQFQKARRHLETARRLAPSDPTVLNNLALSLLRSPDPDLQQALSLAEMVLQAIPENPDALSTRAEIQGEQQTKFVRTCAL